MDMLDTLQNIFLDELIQNKSSVSVYLKNSIRLKGYIIAYDTQIMYLKSQGIQVIYKKSISAVCPEVMFKSFETS